MLLESMGNYLSRAVACGENPARDRGLLHEELTRSATREEAREVAGKKLDLYLCANRTCEVGMEHATRAPYESFLYSLEELTRT